MRKYALGSLAVACVISVIWDNGIPLTLLVLLSTVISGLAVITPVWLLGFIVICVVDGVKVAWGTLNPITLVKECFFRNVNNEEINEI